MRSIRWEASASPAPSEPRCTALVFGAGGSRHGTICDQTIALNGFYAAKHYPGQLRRIRYRDPETGKNLVFLTNQFALPAPTICALYRCRWQVELFFKWIKQHLRIKRFYGTSENAVRTQIWIAISVYVLVAIIKKQLRLDVSLHALLQILSLTLFEKLPLKQAVASVEPFPNNQTFHSQLNLFEFNRTLRSTSANARSARSATVSDFAPELLRLFSVVMPRVSRFPFSDGPAQCCAPSPDPASEQRLIAGLIERQR